MYRSARRLQSPSWPTTDRSDELRAPVEYGPRSRAPALCRIRGDTERGCDVSETLLLDDGLFSETADDLRRRLQPIQRSPHVRRRVPHQLLSGRQHLLQEWDGHNYRAAVLRLREYQCVDPIGFDPGDRGDVQAQAHRGPLFLPFAPLPCFISLGAMSVRPDPMSSRWWRQLG